MASRASMGVEREGDSLEDVNTGASEVKTRQDGQTCRNVPRSPRDGAEAPRRKPLCCRFGGNSTDRKRPTGGGGHPPWEGAAACRCGALLANIGRTGTLLMKKRCIGSSA